MLRFVLSPAIVFLCIEIGKLGLGFKASPHVDNSQSTEVIGTRGVIPSACRALGNF